jgi:hypothetical protein
MGRKRAVDFKKSVLCLNRLVYKIADVVVVIIIMLQFFYILFFTRYTLWIQLFLRKINILLDDWRKLARCYALPSAEYSRLYIFSK